MAEVGELPLAVLVAEDARRAAARVADGLEQRGDTAGAQDRRPLVEPDVHVLPGLVVGGGHVVDRPADERAERRGVDPRRPTTGARSPRAAPATPGRRRAEDAAAPATTAGTPAASSASRTTRPWRCVATSTAMSPGPRRSAAVRRRHAMVAGESSSSTMSAARSAATSSAGWSDVSAQPCGVCVDAPVAAVDDAHPQRCGVRRRRAAGCVGGPSAARTVRYSMPGCAERRRVEQRVVARRPAAGRCASCVSSVATVVSRGRPRRGRCARRRRGTRRSPASDRRSAPASSCRRRTPLRTMSHCTGSVSWNSSTITTPNALAQRSAGHAGRRRAACSRVSRSS